MFASSLRTIAGAALACTVLAHTADGAFAARRPVVALQRGHQQTAAGSVRRVHGNAQRMQTGRRRGAAADSLMQKIVSEYRRNGVVAGTVAGHGSRRLTVMPAATARNIENVGMLSIPCSNMLLVPFDSTAETKADACVRGSPCPEMPYVPHDAPTKCEIDHANACLWASVPPTDPCLQSKQSAARLYRRTSSSHDRGFSLRRRFFGSSSSDSSSSASASAYANAGSSEQHPNFESYAVCLPNPAAIGTDYDFEDAQGLEPGVCMDPSIQYPFIDYVRASIGLAEYHPEPLCRYSPDDPYSQVLSSLANYYIALLGVPAKNNERWQGAVIAFDQDNYSTTLHHIELAFVNTFSLWDTFELIIVSGDVSALTTDTFAVPITPDMVHAPGQPATIFRFTLPRPIFNALGIAFVLDRPSGRPFFRGVPIGVVVTEINVHAEKLQP